MLNPSIRDIQFRKVRFALAIIGVALLFMLILVMDGIAVGMKTALTQYLEGTKADAWAVQSDTDGPFTSFSALPETPTVEDVRAIPGVDRADPLIFTMQNVKIEGESKRVYLVGYETGSVFEPKEIKKGRLNSSDGEAVVDENVNVKVGARLKIGGKSFKVAGKSRNTTYAFNNPIVFISLSDAQKVLFNGQLVVNTVAVTGKSGAPLSSIGGEIEAQSGVETKTQKQMINLVLKQVDAPRRAISIFSNMFWLVGALIVAMIVYITAVERTQDFAVFKAIGATNGYITRLVILQALFIGLAAALGGAILALSLAPAFPIKTIIPTASLASTPLIAIIVSIGSSLVAIRRAATVDPALAFGGK